jgi:hypothetical protein
MREYIKMKKLKLITEHLPITLGVIYLNILLNSESSEYHILGILIFGWLIDADHLIDYLYYLFNSKKNLSISEFLSGNYFKKNNLVIIPGHSVELTIIIFILGFIFDDKGLYFVSLAHLLHLVQYLYSNKVDLFGYFLTYRIKNKFLLSKICKN